MYSFLIAYKHNVRPGGTISENLDETDRKIIQHVCNGTYSHSELAENLGVSRNTVYRRLKDLEEKGMLKERVMAIPDFDKIGYSSIIIGLNVGLGDMEKTVNFLKDLEQVKFLWKTYGQYEIVSVLMCDKRNVGTCINNLKEALERLEVEIDEFNAAPSISWEKVELSPFGDSSS